MTNLKQIYVVGRRRLNIPNIRYSWTKEASGCTEHLKQNPSSKEMVGLWYQHWNFFSPPGLVGIFLFHLRYPKQGDKYPKQSPATTHWPSQSCQERLLVDAECRTGHTYGSVKDQFYSCFATAFIGGNFAHQSWCVQVCCAGPFAVEWSIMGIQFQKYSSNFFLIVSCKIESSIAHFLWLLCQKRRVAAE